MCDVCVCVVEYNFFILRVGEGFTKKGSIIKEDIVEALTHHIKLKGIMMTKPPER